MQSIRTDLDRFSVKEINSLAQHGYEVARKVCRQQQVIADARIPDTPPWQPVLVKEPEIQPANAAPFPGPALATKLSRRLRMAGWRRVWSTLLDWRDWPSYVYLLIAFVLLFFVPLQVYQLYRKSQMQAMVIDAITSGNPEVGQILDLVTSDPTSEWIGDEIPGIPQASEAIFRESKC